MTAMLVLTGISLFVGAMMFIIWFTYLKPARTPSPAPAAPTTSNLPGGAPESKMSKAVRLGFSLLLPLILIYFVIDWAKNPVGKAVMSVVPGIGPGAEELIPFLLWWAPFIGVIVYIIVSFFKKPVVADAKGKQGGERYHILVPLVLGLAAVCIYLGMAIQEEKAPGVVRAGNEVEFNLKGGKGTRTEKLVEPNDIMVVSSMRHPRADGQMIYLPCGRIIGPQVVLDNSRLPTRLFVNRTEDGKFFNRIVFSPEAKRVFAGGVAQLRVEWYIIETTRSQAPTACRHVAW